MLQILPTCTARAYASDVAEGPLASARAAIAEAGEEKRCEAVLCDGAAALAGRGIGDVAICGMGGELIARIIEDASWLFDPAVRLILQPMTRTAYLRRFLAERGFCILKETYSIAAGRPYVCLLVEFRGGSCSISRLDAEIGSPENTDAPAFRAYAEQRLRALLREAEGDRLAGRVGDAAETAEAIAHLLAHMQ